MRAHPASGRCAAWPSTGGSPRERDAAGRSRRCSAWSRARSTRTCAGRPPADLVAGPCGEDGRGFDGYGIGGALEKQNLGTIVGWVCEELPDDRPRHLLGHQRARRHVHRHRERRGHLRLRVAVAGGPQRRGLLDARSVQPDQRPLTGATSARWTTTATATPARHYTRAYVHHLFRAKEMLSATLCHHPQRAVRRPAGRPDPRRASSTASFDELRAHVLRRYYGT